MDEVWGGAKARRLVAIAVGLGSIAGCGGSRLQSASISLWGSDLVPNGPSGYNLSLSIMGDSACKSTNSGFAITLDGAPLAYDDCLASASGLLENRSFTIGLHDGGDDAEVIVSNLFSGLDAAISTAAGGQITAGGTFDVSVPTALQFEMPQQFGAQFIYEDTDDPSYFGDATNPTAGPGVVHVVAPQHAGHFTLWISMSAPLPATYPALLPKATIASCSGLSSCSAFGAPDIGPLAVTVQ